jgi:membrane-associated protease RseP (regulator of RpoE activity)
MRRPALSLALSVLLCGFPIVHDSTTAAQSNAVQSQFILQDGTPVRLRLTRNVSSADATVGESVDFEVLDEVNVNGVAVIPKSSTAIGTVTEAVPKRRMARGGKLEIVLDYVRLADTEKAPVRAVKDAKGGGHTGGMTAGIVATGLLFWPAAPFFLFMHGKDITIPKGAEVVAYVNGDQKLSAARFGPAGIDQSQVNSTAPAKSGPNDALAPNGSAPGSIQVQSNPDSAEVYVDGSLIGDTPATLKLNPGQHAIRVVLTGYKEWSRELSIQAGSEAHLTANLQQNEAVRVADETHASNSPTITDSGKQMAAVLPPTDAKLIGWIGIHAENKGDAAVVTNVSADGPGAKAGIQVGDIILALDGRLIKGKDFESAVAALKPGTQISVNYARGSASHEVQITVASQN